MITPSNTLRLSAGDKVAVGRTLVEVSESFADSIEPGDGVLGVASTGMLRRLPKDVVHLVDRCVSDAVGAFAGLAGVDDDMVDRFFDRAAALLGDDDVFAHVRTANDRDVQSARARGRSTTRLVLSDKMRAEMVSAFEMWRDLPHTSRERQSVVNHAGWSVEEWRAPLGVIGFVFEGRPNVFADATGVLKSRNTVVFRIGSDALGTALALMDRVVRPALSASGLPEGSVVLVESPEHSAGWALFSDGRLSLAVARGSGEAVAELGSIARQSGVPVSLHGTGGAWILAGESAGSDRLFNVVRHSLDRKVCNTVNVVCVPKSAAARLVPVVWSAAVEAAAARGTSPRIHAVNGAEGFLGSTGMISVIRAGGPVEEEQVTIGHEDALGDEFEWEETPEFHLVVTESMEHSISLFNDHSPKFIVSVVSEDDSEIEATWTSTNSPFFGDGFTRWVDGQFALLRPELGLSNWQTGRLFARSGILSGDSGFTVRLRMRQQNPEIHR